MAGTTGKQKTAKQLGSTAKKPRGKPFEKGHAHAWKSGQSGNPAGRPKSRTLSEELRDRLKEQYPGQPDATYGRMLAHKLIDIAFSGELAAIREVFDRVEGKPRQTVDLKIETQKREMIENAISALMSDAGIEREEAVEQLAAITPEMNGWIN